MVHMLAKLILLEDNRQQYECLCNEIIGPEESKAASWDPNDVTCKDCDILLALRKIMLPGKFPPHTR